MARKVKSFLYLLSGIIAFALVVFSYSLPASALTRLDFSTLNLIAGSDISVSGTQRLDNGYYYFVLKNTSNYDGYGKISLNASLLQTGVNKDQLITVNFAVSFSTTDPNGTTDSGANINLDLTPLCPAYVNFTTGQGVVEECNIANMTPLTIKSGNGGVNTHNNSSKTYAVYNYQLRIRPTSESFIQLKNIYFGPIAGAYSQGRNINVTVLMGNSEIDYRPDPVVEAIKDSSDQAHKDNQAQLDWDKQQAEKEEQQRKDDEEKANQTGSDSQDKSDSSQSDVDSASKGLFDILTSFVGAITGASPGTCVISGDFGFFNAGNIDLCSGASKITPITNVVGAVMLIALVIPACVVLLHRFVDLYNEVMQ